MPTFSYIGLDAQGVEQRGQLEVSDEKEAAKVLRTQAIFLLQLCPGDRIIEQGDWRSQLRNFLGILSLQRILPVKDKDLILLFRQLALMLRAGHTLVQALDAAASMVSKHRLKRALNNMASNIQRGMSFSAAMAAETSLFSKMLAKLIESGEHSGDLEPVLERLADNMEKRTELKRHLQTALTYPTFVVLASVGVIVFLVTTVVPRFAKFLNGRGADIPASTQTLMDIAAWFEESGSTVAMIIGVTIIGVLVAYTTERGKYQVDRVLLHVPLIGQFLINVSIAQSSWTLAMLLRSGVTLLQALKVTAASLQNAVMSTKFSQAAEAILQGKTLSNALNQKHIPLMVSHMIAIGEKSGELDSVAESLGEYYRKQLEASVKTMSAMIEPILILVVGAMVGFVYFAFFQAVLSVSTGGR